MGFAESAAWGYYLDSDDTASNFGQLSIHTSSEYEDEEQVFAAGYLEGVLTAPRIFDNFNNMYAYFTSTMNVTLAEPMRWIDEQDRWVRNKCDQHSSRRQRGSDSTAGGGIISSSLQSHVPDGVGTRGLLGQGSYEDSPRYWDSVCLLLRQFDGMVEGYQAQYDALKIYNVVGRLRYRDFLFMMSNADLYDVIDWMDPSQGPTWSVQSGASPATNSSRLQGRRAQRHTAWLEELRRDPARAAAKLFSDVALSGKCSALVKLAADLSEIYMGHSTWDTYTAALRIFKHYDFALEGLKPAARRVSFSSYPGELFSDDDLYMMDSKLVVLQTTNKVFNDEVFEELNPHTVLSWQRVRTANWLAANGEEWAGYLKTRNSGTYNNQYMVVDLNKFKPKQAADAGLLWVVEQLPGLVVAADMTPTLCMGYWPSFNVPFFPEADKYGQHFDKTTHWLSYQSSPRAKIFRRDQAGVLDLDGMKRIMRYNDWRKDPYSEGHPICAVCGRGDLDPEAPVARGCFDTKVTTYEMALNMEAHAVNGPTVDQGQLPPFDWHKQFPDMEHRGQPRRFTFEFEVMSAAALEGMYNAAHLVGCAGGDCDVRAAES
ncbi:hypothetical protein N2152v2_002369 [Parachlorella kessleri]